MIKEIYVRKPYSPSVQAGIGTMFRDEKAERDEANQERDKGLKDLDDALNEGYQCIGNHSSGDYGVYVLHKPRSKKYIPHPDSPHS